MLTVKMTGRHEQLKKIADAIANDIRYKDSEGRKLALGQLEACSSRMGFEGLLLKYVQRGVLTIALDDVKDLMQDWKETRDLMQFRIYEVLHHDLKEGEIPQSSDDD